MDFLENHKEGLSIDDKSCDWLLKTISRDCLVLESFKIMDYSLLIGIHNEGKDIPNVDDEGATNDVARKVPIFHSSIKTDSVECTSR